MNWNWTVVPPVKLENHRKPRAFQRVIYIHQNPPRPSSRATIHNKKSKSSGVPKAGCLEYYLPSLTFLICFTFAFSLPLSLSLHLTTVDWNLINLICWRVKIDARDTSPFNWSLTNLEVRRGNRDGSVIAFWTFVYGNIVL